MTELSTPFADETLHLHDHGERVARDYPERGASAADILVSEQDAAQVAGLSISTLRRFAEVGALTVVEKEGSTFYSIPAVERLFSVTIPRTRTPIRVPSPLTSPFERSAPEAAELVRGKGLEDEDSEQVPPSEIRSPATDTRNKEEMMVFKQVLEAQDKLLTLKDEEIADLKSQRTWLQQRIEKLEQQSDRDRLILLSEAHTIKQLVAIEANRKSRLRTALEFFGIVPMREPVPAPPPLSWELTTTNQTNTSVSAPNPSGAVTDARPSEAAQSEG